MTMKYEDLEKFVRELQLKYESESIPALVLDGEIMRKFGISNYVVNSIKKALGVTGLMTPIDAFRWRFKHDNGNLVKESQ
jgi:hypothetical protein